MRRSATALNSTPVFRFAYELGLLFAVLLLLLVPIHRAGTWNANIERIVDATHVTVNYPNAARLRPGDQVPIYRFNPDWKAEIGRAVVEGVDGAVVLLAYAPASFRWPMGRQALVTDQDGGAVQVDLGAKLGLARGDRLNLFLERRRVGSIVLTEVREGSSTARVLDSAVPQLRGLVASEFTIPTQAVFDYNPVLSVVEVLLALIVLSAYLGAWLAWRRSPLALLGERIVPALARWRTPRVLIALNLVAGIAFVWLSVGFAVSLIDYLGALLTHALFPHSEHGAWFAFSGFLKRNLPALYAIAGVACASVLFRTRSSPVLLFWNRLKFSGGFLPRIEPGALRNCVIWALHMVIAYAFARTLLGFIQANLRAALDVAWPGSGITLSGAFHLNEPGLVLDLVRGILAAAGHMLTHAPQFASFESVHVTVRYLLWTLTVLGCLVGYCHSIFGYLWGKQIRNLDFTVTGWITNAVCYGPLLGVAFWQMVPPLSGQDPIFASGPILYLDLAAEFFLNAVYMLTIWNLGTMFGVMTDKGVRTSGFYSVVRHPSYTMEALMFFALELKGLSSGAQWFAAAMILVIYWLRSEREDVFMSGSNPEYLEYRKATPYKFVPGIY